LWLLGVEIHRRGAEDAEGAQRGEERDGHAGIVRVRQTTGKLRSATRRPHVSCLHVSRIALRIDLMRCRADTPAA
jgi:hypothetical protein